MLPYKKRENLEYVCLSIFWSEMSTSPKRLFLSKSREKHLILLIYAFVKILTNDNFLRILFSETFVFQESHSLRLWLNNTTIKSFKEIIHSNNWSRLAKWIFKTHLTHKENWNTWNIIICCNSAMFLQLPRKCSSLAWIIVVWKKPFQAYIKQARKRKKAAILIMRIDVETKL